MFPALPPSTAPADRQAQIEAMTRFSLDELKRDPLSCLAFPRPLSCRDEAMVHMHTSGAGPTAIARHFGISRSRVKQILDRAEQSSD